MTTVAGIDLDQDGYPVPISPEAFRALSPADKNKRFVAFMCAASHWNQRSTEEKAC